jgi:hypothetical protein
LHWPAVQALYDIDIRSIHSVERTCFVFSVLKFALFMSGERLTQSRSNGAAQVRAGGQRKNP